MRSQIILEKAPESGYSEKSWRTRFTIITIIKSLIEFQKLKKMKTEKSENCWQGKLLQGKVEEKKRC